MDGFWPETDSPFLDFFSNTVVEYSVSTLFWAFQESFGDYLCWPLSAISLGRLEQKRCFPSACPWDKGLNQRSCASWIWGWVKLAGSQPTRCQQVRVQLQSSGCKVLYCKTDIQQKVTLVACTLLFVCTICPFFLLVTCTFLLPPVTLVIFFSFCFACG